MKIVEHCKVQNRKNILRTFISIYKKLKEKILVILKVTTTNFKSHIWKCNVDIKKIIVTNKVPIGKRGFGCFTGYKYGKNVRPLCILLPKMTAQRGDFGESKCPLLIRDYKLLEKNMKIGKKLARS